MAEEYGKIRKSLMVGIADAIREKKKTTDLLSPEQMATEIVGIESGSPSSAEVTFGYVKKTETFTEQAPEGKCFYNGVLLPEIPELSNYPYMMMEKLATRYYLVCSTKKYYFNGTYYVVSGASAKNYAITFEELEAGGTWTLKSETAYTQNGPVMWSNYDIPNGSETATEIYFKGSEPLTELTETITQHVPVERESNYSITSESLNNIAKRTQEMAGTTKLMTPDDIIYWLNAVKFVPQGRASSEFSINYFAPSTASGRLPEVVKGAANTTFALDFTSSAVGTLGEV